MKDNSIKGALPRAIVWVALSIGGVGIAGVAFGDDSPPADNPAPSTRHHHDAAWAACKKQADDQKLQPGDPRREFMKTCMKSAKSSTAPAATS